MKHLSAKIACAILTASLFASSFAGCGGSQAVDGTQEAIEINGESVNMGVANFLLRFQQATMLSYYSMFGQDTSAIWDTAAEEGTYGDGFKDDMLETIQKMYLLKEHAADYDVTLSEEDISKADAAAEEFMAANDEATLKTLGVTKEDISEVLKLYAYQNKIYEPMVADTDTNVSDDEAAQTTVTYVKVSTAGTEKDADGNTVELTDEEKAAKKEQAQQVLDAVKGAADVAGADMSEIAKGIDENLTSSARSYGSDDTTLDDAVKTAVEGLTDGQLADNVVEGSDGYYVVRLDKKFDQEKTESKKKEIINTRKQEKYNEILDGWLKEAKVTTSKAWDKLKVTDADVYTFKQPKTDESGDSSTSSSSESGDSSTSSSSGSGDSSTSSSSGSGDNSTSSSSGSGESSTSSSSGSGDASTSSSSSQEGGNE